MKRWYLKLHRWIALLFALPLLVVIATGLILSVEPWLIDRAVQPGKLTADRIDALLAQHDPRHQMQALNYRPYDGTLTLSAGRRGGASTTVDVMTGETKPQSTTTALLITARRLHETLMLDARWLTVASTVAMLVISVIGVLMGWPRFANTLAGWHKAVAWGLLPLLILSPFTALLMSMGVGGGFPQGRGGRDEARMSLSQAVHALEAKHDISGLLFLRGQGGQYTARLDEGGEFRVYTVKADGIRPVPRNWPRLWHEGNFAGGWSSLMNLIISIALLTLLGTGVWIWGRRQLFLRRLRRTMQVKPA